MAVSKISYADDIVIAIAMGLVAIGIVAGVVLLALFGKSDMASAAMVGLVAALSQVVAFFFKQGKK